MPIRRPTSGGGHVHLHAHGGPDRRRGRVERGQHAVARGRDDPAAVAADDVAERRATVADDRVRRRVAVPGTELGRADEVDRQDGRRRGGSTGHRHRHGSTPLGTGLVRSDHRPASSPSAPEIREQRRDLVMTACSGDPYRGARRRRAAVRRARRAVVVDEQEEPVGLYVIERNFAEQLDPDELDQRRDQARQRRRRCALDLLVPVRRPQEVVLPLRGAERRGDPGGRGPRRACRPT